MDTGGTLVVLDSPPGPENDFSQPSFSAATAEEESNRAGGRYSCHDTAVAVTQPESGLPWNNLTICHGNGGRRTSVLWPDVPTSKKQSKHSQLEKVPDWRDGRLRTFLPKTQEGMPSLSTFAAEKRVN